MVASVGISPPFSSTRISTSPGSGLVAVTSAMAVEDFTVVPETSVARLTGETVLNGGTEDE